MESNTETENLIQKVERFAMEMKANISEASKKGREGYKDLPLDVIETEIRKCASKTGEEFSEVDLANWCMIYWLNKKK